MKKLNLLLGIILFLSCSSSIFSKGIKNTLIFDGVDNYVNIDVVTNDITSSSISAEIRFKTNASLWHEKANQLLSFHTASYTNILLIGIGVNGGIYINTGNLGQVKGSGYNDNKWHTLSIIALADGTVYAYVDAVNSFEFNLDVIDWSTAAKCSIGQEYDGTTTTDHFLGEISEVRLWNKQLTIEEINNQLCANFLGSENGLIALYEFENIVTTPFTYLVDGSLYNNDGLIIYPNLQSDWVHRDVSCNNSLNDLVQFSITGDAPYDLLGNTTLTERLESHVIENNEQSYADFLMHVGDIRPGPDTTNPLDVCSIGYYTRAKQALDLSTKDAYILIGDNEWNDCPTPFSALTNWNNTFLSFNQGFKNKFQVNEQVGRPENISYISNSVLFITINQVGGAMAMQDINNWAQRMTDNANWITENITKYKNFVQTCVIYAHSRPNYNNHITGLGNPVLYDPIQNAVGFFAKPVLYIQGDDHVFNWTQPYGWQPKLLRIVIDSDDHINDILQVVVTKDPVLPFYVERTAFSNGLTSSPIIQTLSSSSVSVSWTTAIPTASVVRYGKTNDPLRYREEDLILKTNHQLTINNLDNIPDYQFEVGTRTAKLIMNTSRMSDSEQVESENKTIANVFTNEMVLIYPNPNAGHFNIELKNNVENTLVEVYDLMGKKVFTQNYVSTKFTIDITNQPKGIYLVKMITDNQVLEKKIIYQ